MARPKITLTEEQVREVVTVAFANKSARTAWALLVKEECYKPVLAI